MKQLVTVLLLLAAACHRGDEVVEIPLPTRLCVQTYHHEFPIPEANVFVKYNSDVYPGFDQPATYFDTTFQTGANADGCLAALPIGTHWLIAYGADWQGGTPLPVYGSLKITIDLEANTTIDTVLYVSE
jgi:hypothetical protein